MYPQRLKRGDEIRVIAPSRSMAILSEETIQLATKRLEDLGLKVTFGKNVMKSQDIYECATIKERIDDIHAAFLDKNVKAILTVVGGYNVNQLLKYIDYNIIKFNPKIFCGLSDITALQNAIYSKTGLVTFSGVHFSNFGMKQGFEYSEEYFKRIFMDDRSTISIEPSKYYSSDEWFMMQDNRTFIHNDGMVAINEGIAEGVIIGGNLCTLNLLQGTEFMPNIEDKILFLEDTGNLNSNFLLEFDRNLESLMQLKQFSRVKGIVFGRAEENSKMTIEKWKIMIANKKELKDIPIIVNANIGHTTPIFTFPIGGKCKINANKSKCEIILKKESEKEGMIDKMGIFSVPVSVHLLLIKENKILLMRRKNTGYADGLYSMPAGKLEPKESVENAIIREVKEEINIDIKNETLKAIQVMNRNGIDRERIDYFFSVDRWNGEINNNEPNKCDDLKWFDIDDLPENIIPYIREAISNYNKKLNFSLFGW